MLGKGRQKQFVYSYFLLHDRSHFDEDKNNIVDNLCSHLMIGMRRIVKALFSRTKDLD